MAQVHGRTIKECVNECPDGQGFREGVIFLNEKVCVLSFRVKSKAIAEERRTEFCAWNVNMNNGNTNNNNKNNNNYVRAVSEFQQENGKRNR